MFSRAQYIFSVISLFLHFKAPPSPSKLKLILKGLVDWPSIYPHMTTSQYWLEFLAVLIGYWFCLQCLLSVLTAGIKTQGLGPIFKNAIFQRNFPKKKQVLSRMRLLIQDKEFMSVSVRGEDRSHRFSMGRGIKTANKSNFYTILERIQFKANVCNKKLGLVWRGHSITEFLPTGVPGRAYKKDNWYLLCLSRYRFL